MAISEEKMLSPRGNHPRSTKRIPPECTGKAAESLKIFRRRVKELEAEGRFKPDMIAFKELKG
eukprot:CAMPEP_0197459992 /NCGR_PEP_ID=MMETSP1175-20131217/52975_1 /TAXON_ID=1003142 /ORGANISM="Triceratium dubium, Strain CCMP147" /LENGTH=62 /DNA_ID=CAMNT_0042995009 /DNA_START=80 /DNA_END=265 /DNA_ORIENTATION=+